MQISLTNRNLAEFDASAFSTKEEREMLYKISKLDVSHNRLTLVKGMQCLSNLTALDVSCNNIRSLSGLPLKIRRLNVSGNDLRSLEGLAALTQLEFLDVSKNDLGSLIGLPSTQSLRHVEASNNKLVSCKGVELTPSLHYLGIGNNIIRRVEDLGALRQLRALKNLQIGNNPICATGRNTAAIRMSVPKITVIDGLYSGHQQQQGEEFDGNSNTDNNVAHRMQHNLKESSQITQPYTQQRSSSAGPFPNTSGIRGRSPNRNGTVVGGSAKRSGSAERANQSAASSLVNSRPISPIGRRNSNDVTPNTSTMTIAGLHPSNVTAARGNAASNNATTSGRTASSSRGGPLQQPALTVGGPTLKGTQSTYEILLRDLEMSKVRAQRGMTARAASSQSPAGRSSGNNHAGLNATHINTSSSSRQLAHYYDDSQPSMDKHARARSADALRKNTLMKANHLDISSANLRTGVVPHTCPETMMERDARITSAIENSYNGRAPTLNNGSTNANSTATSSANKNGRSSSVGRDGTYEKDLLNAQQPSIEMHRMMEQRIAELERELAFTKRQLEDKKVECDNAHLQVKQLKETIDRQARVNSVLADTNRSLSVSAVALQNQSVSNGVNNLSSAQHGANRSVTNAVRPATELHAERPKVRESPRRLPDDDRAVAPPQALPPNRLSRSSPSQPTSSSSNNNYYGSSSGSNSCQDQENYNYDTNSGHRAHSKEPKKGSGAVHALHPSNYHQTVAPIIANSSSVVRNAYVDPTTMMASGRSGSAGGLRTNSNTAASGRRGPSHDNSYHRNSPQRSSAQNSRNVSFGGSLYYSPPQHYNH